MTKRREKKEWTVMIYFASDNPLAPSVISQLKAIKEAGFHPQVNVVAHFDPHVKEMANHTFEINLVNRLTNGNRPQVGFKGDDPFVRNLLLDKLYGDTTEEKKIKERIRKQTKAQLDYSANGRDEEVVYDPPLPPDKRPDDQNPKDGLASFLKFCCDFYPACHYMLFILGHGIAVGNDIFLFDADTPNSINVNDPEIRKRLLPILKREEAEGRKPGANEMDLPPQHSLLLTDLGRVLKKFSDDIQKHGSELELIGFHSCSMSGLEVAYQIKDSAKYMLASQGPAFVGSWPYRQILVRLFKNLDASFKRTDVKNPRRFIARFKDGTDPVCRELLSKFSDGTQSLLKQCGETQLLQESLTVALIEELNGMINETGVDKMSWIHKTQLSYETRQLRNQLPTAPDPTWYRRMLLQDAFAAELKRECKPDVKELVRLIFAYCAYNSYDFQLAGYSFDIALCDLTSLKNEVLTTRLNQLSRVLIRGLGDQLIKGLILLAHWDAQSYWQENYTDLYDFCFRLYDRCQRPTKRAKGKTARTLKAINRACIKVMKGLEHGPKKEYGNLVLRSKFVGPAYQYSHGLSVYFPWSQPVDGFFAKQYKGYAFKETEWSDFLATYFSETQRESRLAECPRDPVAVPYWEEPTDSEKEVIPTRAEEFLLQNILATGFNKDGQLSKGGPGDSTGKGGAGDASGDDCDCPSIKNYPSRNVPMSHDFPKPQKPESQKTKRQKKRWKQSHCRARQHLFGYWNK